MKTIYTLIALILVSIQVKAQDKIFTKTGHATFYSHALLEDIKADNNQVVAIIDTKTGEFKILMLMQSFMFKKALMQEHFNENYVESDKFPKAIFKGKIDDVANLNNSGIITFKGLLTIHGVTNETTVIANSVIKGDKVLLTGDFMLKIADYDIEIPSLVKGKIAKELKISFDFELKPYK